MDIKPKKPDVSVEEITVVLIGDFNPKIFHPMWFAHHGVLREAEAMEARIEVVHTDVSSFTTEWLTVQVLRDRFTAAVKAEVYRPHLGDLVRNVFTLLGHSPVRQMGLNSSFRVHFKSTDDWHSLGHFILPKSPWHDVLSKPGLRNVSVQGNRTDKRLGLINVTIEPDIRLPGDALLRINDHFDTPYGKDDERATVLGAGWALEILAEEFDGSYQRAKSIMTRLVDNFLATNTLDAGEKDVRSV